MEGGAGADGTYNLEGTMWLALSREPLYISDSRKPPLPTIARISIISGDKEPQTMYTEDT